MNPCMTLQTKCQWERDMGVPISETQWNAALRKCTSISKCVRYKIIQLKTIHRAYMTPGTMNKIDPSMSSMCWHGCGSKGTLVHMLWNCPAVQQFWHDIANDLTTVLNTGIALCPIVCLLGVEMDGIQSKKLQHILSLAFLVAKRTILINWKERKDNRFSIDHWRNDFMDILAMEQAALSLNSLERPNVSQGPLDFMRTFLA